jgi:hypothetical protein
MYLHTRATNLFSTRVNSINHLCGLPQENSGDNMKPLHVKHILAVAVIAVLASTELYASGDDNAPAPTHSRGKKLSPEVRDKRTADQYRATMQADANGMSDKEVIAAYPKWSQDRNKAKAPLNSPAANSPVTDPSAPPPTSALTGKTEASGKVPANAVNDVLKFMKK